MTCYHPIQATQSYERKPNGKYHIYFGTLDAKLGNPIELPCGKCTGCRLEQSRQWAIRCYHESRCYENNAFLTLTYDPEHLPASESVEKRELQLFMKKLRKKYVPKNPYDEEQQPEEYNAFREKHWIRFFACGEYGELCKKCRKVRLKCTCQSYLPSLGRPHYHACIFNFNFPDREVDDYNEGQVLYSSEALNQLWGNGRCWIGEVTFESAAYVARYVMKKITGDPAADHYFQLDKETGLCYDRNPEFVTMSRRPGIGKPWLARYQDDVYPEDTVIINERKVHPPKFYDTQFEIKNPEKLAAIKEARALKTNSADNTDKRLKVRERVTLLNLKKKKRKYHEI